MKKLSDNDLNMVAGGGDCFYKLLDINGNVLYEGINANVDKLPEFSKAVKILCTDKEWGIKIEQDPETVISVCKYNRGETLT